MQEWLIALGILVAVAFLLEGMRRMRNARRDSLQMSLSMHQGIDRSELDEYGNEFPSGPARVVGVRGEEDELHDTVDTPSLSDTGRRRLIDFDQVAPMLMDVKVDHQQRIEPGFGADDEDILSSPTMSSQTMSSRSDEIEEDEFDPEVTIPFGRGAKSPGPVFDTATSPLGLGESEIISKPRVYERPANQPPPRREPPVIKPSKPVIKAREERDMQSGQADQRNQPEQKTQQLPLEDVIIISVMAKERGGFPGAALLEIMLANGLRYGHRSIFHKYTGEEREEESLYSVANAVKPGTFDLNKMETFQTPGITLFLSLPSPGGKAMDAFDSMLATSRAVAEQLNGELRDENRSVMTGQTIEHCRQRIRDFEMQSRLRAR